ncbi:S24/S26 family peptidase [Cohnella fermenti]|uniref:Peptidase S24/S26A/S26B/S26C domain-containing protein n=1 Tax=Cohnella fermenti TaxID=2565925 RepID=A0A4V3WE33_9BACL|nr:S24/S26 family peptidase [Cohnella fermenti]THF74709.1 hypothetical protein E6C55_24160 [Cohnella fermenti]
MRDELLKTFRGLMQAKREVVLPASGLSMYPYILPGDECRFVPVRGRLAPGEVGLFVSDDGVLLSHRLHRTEPWNDELRYWLRGDGNFGMDGPVGEERIVGVLSEVKRGGRIHAEQKLLRRLWARWSIRYPKLLKLTAHASRLKAKRAGAAAAVPDSEAAAGTVRSVR